ncbi:MAG: Fe-S cluster assembly protein SufD [Candidatus Omnitrophica bacterium]|nr:Fe-S cluster assembly protein SufD [Candidatus Omnitrophota bacterium]
MVNLSVYPAQVKKDRYLKAFELLEKEVGAKSPSWISQIRKRAVRDFSNLGFPTLREENWKYTNVNSIAQTSFAFPSDHAAPQLSAGQLEPFGFGGSRGQRFVFVNGFYASELSSEAPSRNGPRAESLESVLTRDPKLAEPYLARLAPYDRHIFTALNTAFMHQGAFIYLPEGKVLNEPIHLLFVSSPQEEAMIFQPRVLIVAGKNSRAAVIENYVSLGSSPYFTNTVTEIVLEEGAFLEHYKLQRESENAFHVGTTHVRQSRASKFRSFSLALGAKLCRNNLNVNLDQEGAGCTLNGLYLVTGEQHVDHTTLIDHSKPNGTSNQIYKGILSGKATGVFSGKVLVHKDAQKTDAHQINKNLLLSDQSTMNTKPQLEILADDVQCTHGAAVGQLDEKAIFYFETRGISREKARKLLSYGFANEVIQAISYEPIRTELNRLVFKRLEDFSCLPEALKHRSLEKDVPR